MKEVSLKKKIQDILKVIYQRHKALYKIPMTAAQKKELIFSLEESFARERLIIKYQSTGELAYYFQFKPSFMGEFEEVFFHIQSSYCANDKKNRNEFYKAIDQAFYELKSFTKFKRMMIEVAIDDEESKSYFSKKGFLTYVELLGNTTLGLEKLKDVDFKKAKFRLTRLKKNEIKKLIVLDQEAHILDKSSRMNKIFSKPNARKTMEQFYNGLYDHGLCFVAKDGKRLVGDIGIFFDKKNGLGLIAGIFVAHKYKNRGISKLLYKAALMEFKKRKFKKYLGATTTTGVLKVAQKIGRVGTKCVYIVKP